MRSLLFYFFILINAALIGWLIIPSLLAWLKVGKTLTHDEAAKIIGRHFNNVNDKLLNTLQLKNQAGLDPRQRELIEAGINQKIKELKPVSFPSAINLKQNRRYLKWILMPFGIICIIGLAAPSVLTESTKRLIKHNQYFAPASPFQFTILNPGLTAVQGDDLPLEIKLSGNSLPGDVYIETAGNTFKLDKRSVSRFSYVFKNMQQNISFRLTANGYSSVVYHISVNYRPTLINFDVEINYPAYLHKKAEKLANAGDLTIPAGTVVKWNIHTKNTSLLAFTINRREHLLNANSDGLFSHSERILSNSYYKLVTSNKMVSRNSDSSAYRINVIADEAPAINVEQKQDSISSKAIYFRGNILDDHGFSGLTFNYRIDKQDEKPRLFVKKVKINLSQTQSDFFYYWDLKDTGIKPGEKLTYYFEVADNDGVAGPKRSRSAERTFDVPDARQMNEQLAAGAKAI
ncbi:MAG: hypothetical protein EOP47_28320, partial [Sphingobacteriaceae bacterium]